MYACTPNTRNTLRVEVVQREIKWAISWKLTKITQLIRIYFVKRRRNTNDFVLFGPNFLYRQKNRLNNLQNTNQDIFDTNRCETLLSTCLAVSNNMSDQNKKSNSVIELRYTNNNNDNTLMNSEIYFKTYPLIEKNSYSINSNNNNKSQLQNRPLFANMFYSTIWMLFAFISTKV